MAHLRNVYNDVANYLNIQACAYALELLHYCTTPSTIHIFFDHFTEGEAISQLPSLHCQWNNSYKYGKSSHTEPLNKQILVHHKSKHN